MAVTKNSCSLNCNQKTEENPPIPIDCVSFSRRNPISAAGYFPRSVLELRDKICHHNIHKSCACIRYFKDEMHHRWT
ncbi:hypothetical protein MPTK1_8g03670 [Marchantia polymorpha subsp. ruderalis]|uniref:Uncharacterized protein n=1 Tax=Marchantia polymorpha TaxID=3197 RepID=A0A2R6XJD6_MARPO|nr:hypothetical protein MARPO_0012s0157 [Marchantia polymorpha]PTQ46230.1 hypothetical protein MARPO_0012s0158 [Marchantia polymorpha]BBN18582.1 hypothetical protein Mp_8g03670 [Marchantia polymorpha subsp. ruderalis]BBN18583.1 hypothetical protein Mp_8g03680 [Marchantia polymorpha subsp. ruderalis]|eukprot:PTQ46229.1 hypothetical protein MARPO_0012s0157 [Marchantia polymorpha]